MSLRRFWTHMLGCSNTILEVTVAVKPTIPHPTDEDPQCAGVVTVDKALFKLEIELFDLLWIN